MIPGGVLAGDLARTMACKLGLRGLRIREVGSGDIVLKRIIDRCKYTHINLGKFLEILHFVNDTYVFI